MSSPIQFTHLHVHSQYSLLDGKASIPELVDKCIATGMRGIALTDHGNMFGIKEFFNYVEKKNADLPDDRKFKPILGCEMYVARDHASDKKDKRDNGYHLIVLAKNEKGYHNLVKLVSKAWTEGYYYKPRTDRYELESHKEGLIICSACLGGEVPQFIMHDELDKAEERVKWYKDTFGDDYYLELQRHQTFKPNANRDVYAEQVKVNEQLLKFAEKYNIKVIATNDVHFTNEEDAEAHDRLICVSMQKKFSEPRLHYTKQEWLKTPEEMLDIFKDIPEALLNTQEILDKVETYSINHAPIMPFFDIPAEFGSEQEYRRRITEEDLFNEFTRDENGNVVLSEEDAKKKIARLGGYDKLYRIKFEADYLEKLTMEGAKERYGDPIPEDVRERLKFELYIMKTMGFPGYFLIVQDFINTARKKLGVSVGPGRGSAAGSAAAYCLGITQIDPIKYDLLFERFLNPDRISLPDIDVDFDDDGRYEVLKYVTQKYGEEKVAHIITFGTMATKMAIKDVAKVLEVPLAESNRLAKLVPDRMPEIDGKTPKTNFKNCAKYVKEFAAEVNSPDEKIRETMKYAEQLEGNIRNTGVHACGVIISRDDITDWVPVSMAEEAGGGGKVLTTQYEGSIIEDTGLIKMDFLGLKTLSIIKETLYNIKQRHGFDLDIDHIPLDDKDTFDLYCKGNTTSTFQFESTGMQDSLRKLQPSKFEDLIAMNALYRPGPMDYIPTFIARKHGEQEIVYDIPCMKQYLEETYGVTVYQEQVMLLSRLLANFTRGESDMLRKAMGKKQIDKMQKLKKKFMEQGVANGHPDSALNKIWEDWEKFASYAFNKSHATCYSWVAYQTAYLKAHYPAEYMAGVLSRNLSQNDKLRKVMDECKRMGLTVLGPDINESSEKFGVNAAGAIRFGLGAIKGVGVNAVNAIIYERDKNGPFKDIYDFVERVNLSACNRSSIENLAMAGAFDQWGVAREAYVHEMFDSTYTDCLVKYGQRIQNDKNSLQLSLFGDLEPIETAKPPVPEFTPMSRMALLDKEKELVTMYLSAHPLDPYYMELTYGCNTSCEDFKDKEAANTNVSVGGLVTKVQTKLSRKGTEYSVIEIEDFSGKAEIRLFGRMHAQYHDKFHEGEPVIVRISYTARRFDPSRVDMNIESILPLDTMKGKIANNVTLVMDLHFSNRDFYSRISSLKADDRPGTLYVELVDTATKQTLLVKSRKKIAMNRELITILEESGIPFKVGTEEQ
ncbi:MAG: DNA polymerase III subunit alpha [Candidatus Amulumruptor caecigallinarius]|nr:DNA polymerase III subunit alpha [Candidatus Amulumruptor caecigallinarius]